MPNIADRVKETSVGTGTSSMPLLGAPTGFRSFLAAFGDAQPCYYCIAHDSLDEWETGYGTIESGAPDMLTRDEVYESTNANALVDFSPGENGFQLLACSSKRRSVRLRGWQSNLRQPSCNRVAVHLRNPRLRERRRRPGRLRGPRPTLCR